jgi:pantetheine-phosphate adenylyltransferase
LKIAIYPGTFDPITFGHIDVIRRSVAIFDKVIVTLALNSNKKPLFNLDERLAQVTEAVKDIPNVEVMQFDGLLVKFAQEQKAVTIIRGVRAVSDFDYEFQMALTNRKLAGDIVTVFLAPHEKYSYLNSNIVREVARHGGNVECFVPDFIVQALRNKFRENSK